MLNSTPAAINSAQGDAAPVMPSGCRYDTTPVAVGDGDNQGVRCTLSGEVFVAPVAGLQTEVDIQEVDGNPVNTNGGNRDAATITMTLADNDPAVVDLAAIEVTQGTIAGDTTSLDGKVTTGGGVEAGAVLVTVASDSTGVLSVDDGTGSLTVDPTPMDVVVRTTLTCDDDPSDGPTFTTSAAAVAVRAWNTDTTDAVCVQVGGTTPDYAIPATCTGGPWEPWAGVGTNAWSYEFPTALAASGIAARCDAPPGQTAAVVFEEWRQ